MNLTTLQWCGLQRGALSLVRIVESSIELKYFHDVATPGLLCHKEPARRIQGPLLWALARNGKGPIISAGSLWHKRAGVATS